MLLRNNMLHSYLLLYHVLQYIILLIIMLLIFLFIHIVLCITYNIYCIILYYIVLHTIHIVLCITIHNITHYYASYFVFFLLSFSSFFSADFLHSLPIISSFSAAVKFIAMHEIMRTSVLLMPPTQYIFTEPLSPFYSCNLNK